METLTINCWVRGSDTQEVFQVNISKTETVAALQVVIKNMWLNLFRNVSANTLSLYKLKNPVPTPVKEHLRKIILSEHAERLEEALQELSEVFLVPLPEHHIHIIVGV